MTETPGVAAGTDMPTTSGLTSVAGAGVGGDTPAMIEVPGVTTGTDTPTTSSVVSVTGSGVEEDTPPMIEALGVTTGTDTPTTSSAVGVADSGNSPKAPQKTQEILGKFVKEWLQIVDKEDMKNMAMFLCFQLVKLFGFTETKAAEYTATMINKSERTVRRWRSGLIENDGVLPESQQGRYQRSGVLWQNEELNKKATEYVRGNAAVKGRPNLTTVDYCIWVNESMFPNSTLEPGFPRKISLETARLWLHHLGFEVLTMQKGIFIDGHEREDVVDSHKLFLRKMTKLGFLHFTNAPTEDAMKALPSDIDPPTNDTRSKTVVFFHDESTFMSNEDQPTQWGMKGEKMMKPKSKGAGIMVSDFIDEHNGFLALSDDEYQAAKALKPNIRKYAREQLKYGESKEGYWTRDKFIIQMHRAVEIAEIKYSKEEGWRHVWVFDHSSCHAAMADDALDVNRMNVKPGGKQRIMRDTTWNGKVWKMYFTERDGKVAKGMRMVLEERGVSTVGKGGDWMRQTLAEHSDFKNEKSEIETLLIKKGHVPCFLPKFHPELNPIERVWAQLKRFTKAHCKYSLPSLVKIIPLAYDSVTTENIRNHFRKVRHYMFCYLEGLTPGQELDQALVKYKTAVKSHRRISINE